MTLVQKKLLGRHATKFGLRECRQFFLEVLEEGIGVVSFVAMWSAGATGCAR